MYRNVNQSIKWCHVYTCTLTHWMMQYVWLGIYLAESQWLSQVHFQIHLIAQQKWKCKGVSIVWCTSMCMIHIVYSAQCTCMRSIHVVYNVHCTCTRASTCACNVSDSVQHTCTVYECMQQSKSNFWCLSKLLKERLVIAIWVDHDYFETVIVLRWPVSSSYKGIDLNRE